MVPGDGDVHEPLEEIALARIGGPPCIFERLVGGEILLALDQVEPSLVVLVELAGHGRNNATERLISSRFRGTLPAVATILVAGVDVFFRGKLDALLGSRHKLVTTDSVEAPELVIVDIARVDPEEVAEEYPDIPILGFTTHTDTAGLRAAQAAGFDRVVVRSALAERAPEIVEELVT